MLNVSHSEFKGRCGIYCIENLITNKQYIGSSKDIYHRLKRHLCDLRKQRHGNPHLQNSFNKYGEEAWVSKILEICCEEELLNKEQKYINILKPKYNKILTPVRPNLPQSSKDKISNTLRKRYKAGEITTYKQDHAQIPIHIYDIFGEYVETFPSIIDASKFLNASSKSMRRNRNNKELNVDYINNYFFSTMKKNNISKDIIQTIKYRVLCNMKIYFPILLYDENKKFKEVKKSRKGLEAYLPELRKNLYRNFKHAGKGVITFAGYKLKDVYES